MNEKESQQLYSDWLQRLVDKLREGDLLGEAEPEEMVSIFRLAWKMLSKLDKDSPVSQDEFSSHLTGYVLRCPDRLPQALYLVSIVPGDGIPLLMNSRRTRDAAVQSLREVFGGHEHLCPAYEAFRARKLDAGRYAALLEDFGKLLSSTC